MSNGRGKSYRHPTNEEMHCLPIYRRGIQSRYSFCLHEFSYSFTRVHAKKTLIHFINLCSLFFSASSNQICNCQRRLEGLPLYRSLQTNSRQTGHRRGWQSPDGTMATAGWCEFLSRLNFCSELKGIYQLRNEASVSCKRNYFTRNGGLWSWLDHLYREMCFTWDKP